MPAKTKNAWPSLEPGQLRHQIQIQSQTTTPDAFGQPQASWSTIRTSWAKIEALTQQEAFQPDQFTARVTHRITMRYPNGVSIQGGMRVLYGSHTYLIQNVNNYQERNAILFLKVLEINATE
jgi:SPP1 family predicted phage head-tail adaptor